MFSFLSAIVLALLWTAWPQYNKACRYIKKAITGIEAIARKVVSWSCVCHLSPRILIKGKQATLHVRKVGRVNRTSVCVMVQIEPRKMKRPRLRGFGTWFVTVAVCYKRLKGNTLVFLFFYLLPLFLNDHKFWLWEGLSPAFTTVDVGAFPLIADTIVTLFFFFCYALNELSVLKLPAILLLSFKGSFAMEGEVDIIFVDLIVWSRAGSDQICWNFQAKN